MTQAVMKFLFAFCLGTTLIMQVAHAAEPAVTQDSEALSQIPPPEDVEQARGALRAVAGETPYAPMNGGATPESSSAPEIAPSRVPPLLRRASFSRSPARLRLRKWGNGRGLCSAVVNYNQGSFLPYPTIRLLRMRVLSWRCVFHRRLLNAIHRCN